MIGEVIMPGISISSAYLKKLRIGTLGAKWNSAGTRILRYYIDLNHTELDLHKELSAPELDILQNKVDALVASWDKKYEVFIAKEKIAASAERADELTREALALHAKLSNTLNHTLKVDDTVDWDTLRPKEVFRPKPFPTEKPKIGRLPEPPEEPKIGFFDRLLGRTEKIRSTHAQAVKSAMLDRAQRESQFEATLNSWKIEKSKWEESEKLRKEKFEKNKANTNSEIDKLAKAWATGDAEAITEHASIVLESSSYPDVITKEFDIDYDVNSKLLIVDYKLPEPEALPLIKNIRFVKSTGEFRETQMSQADKKAFYDDLCYQICLRTIHEIFEADKHSHIEKVAFNGICDTIDKSTGNEITATILSIVVNREEFLAINLERIEPKACFKSLKGVAASTLIGLVPVAPIIKMDKTDRRFVEAKEVNLDGDGGTNLASMPWEDFEHLVRELFEKEFSSRGGEVKITQASSDGGVDAVAYDPDPITGGKIVIQAKRYTKTVGVSAVRDLYGTTLSEGASKGILVTTADYGPDAHKFAADKPLTLLGGSNLLYLLEKHGIKAKIDIAEARKELGLSGS